MLHILTSLLVVGNQKIDRSHLIGLSGSGKID